MHRRCGSCAVSLGVGEARVFFPLFQPWLSPWLSVSINLCTFQGRNFRVYLHARPYCTPYRHRTPADRTRVPAQMMLTGTDAIVYLYVFSVHMDNGPTTVHATAKYGLPFSATSCGLALTYVCKNVPALRHAMPCIHRTDTCVTAEEASRFGTCGHNPKNSPDGSFHFTPSLDRNHVFWQLVRNHTPGMDTR